MTIYNIFSPVMIEEIVSEGPQNSAPKRLKWSEKLQARARHSTPGPRFGQSEPVDIASKPAIPEAFERGGSDIEDQLSGVLLAPGAD